jgi:hypothetical protein
MRTVWKYLKANWNDIVTAIKPGGGGPIPIELFAGGILFIFGVILLNPQYQVVHTQPGYAGLKQFVDSDNFWGSILTVIGVLKFFVRKPILARMVSTFLMSFVYFSLFVNFASTSLSGIVWAFFLYLFVLCTIAFNMLVYQYRRG